MYQPTDSGPRCPEDPAQARRDVAHRLLPGDALELARAAGCAERVQHAVGVVLDSLHRDPLRARVPPRERVVAVGAELCQAAVLDRGDHAAERLTDAAESDAFLDRHARPSLPAIAKRRTPAARRVEMQGYTRTQRPGRDSGA